MSKYNSERIQFSTFISTMPSFMAAYDFHSGKVTSLLGKSDVTPWVRLYFLEPNCISGIYLIHPICALMAVMLNKFPNYSKSSTTAIVVVSSPLRRAAIAILRAILKTTTRWWHLLVNPILQNRYPIMVKCLNIGKNTSKAIYRSISKTSRSSVHRACPDGVCVCVCVFCRVWVKSHRETWREPML